LDATNGHDFEASSFLACVPSWEASKVQRQVNQRAHLGPKWLSPFSTILMGTLLEPSFVFFSFFLFVAPSPSSCIAQQKKEKKKSPSFL